MKQQVKAVIDATLASLKASGQLSYETIPNYNVEVPKNPEHGDWSCNVAMVASKVVGKKPPELAELIIKNLVDPQKIVTGIEKYDAWASQPVFSSRQEPNRWAQAGEWVDRFWEADEAERMRIAQRALDAAVSAHECVTHQHVARIADAESARAALLDTMGARAWFVRIKVGAW